MQRKALLLALFMSCALAQPAAVHAAPQAVYVNLADSLQGTLDEAATALRSALTAAGYEVVAVHEAAVEPKVCKFRARVLVASDPRWVQQIAAHGPRALFAAPIRLALYEDEAGLHLATVNLVSIARTMVAETGLDEASEAQVRELARIARGVLRGAFGNRPYGQLRSRGLIGRTMGIMAGGPFAEKVKLVHHTTGGTAEHVGRIAQMVARGLEHGGGRWQMHGVYRLDLPTQNAVLFGVSGAAMESKSFAIVGAGGDSKRGRFACPGLAHAAAYPIEVLVFAEQGEVKVATVDGMYRMKLFFEDAGKMKFAANMGMPGSIEDEIRALVASGLAGKP